MFTTKYFPTFYSRESTDSLSSREESDSHFEALLVDAHTPSNNVTATSSTEDVSATDREAAQEMSTADNTASGDREREVDGGRRRSTGVLSDEIDYEEMLSLGDISNANPEEYPRMEGPQLYDRIMEYRRKKSAWFEIEILQEDEDSVLAMCNTPRFGPPQHKHQQHLPSIYTRRGLRKADEDDDDPNSWISHAHQRKISMLRAKYKVSDSVSETRSAPQSPRLGIKDEAFVESGIGSPRRTVTNLPEITENNEEPHKADLANDVPPSEMLQYILEASQSYDMQDTLGPLSAQSQESMQNSTPICSADSDLFSRTPTRRFHLHHPFRSHTTYSPGTPSPGSPQHKTSRFGSLRKRLSPHSSPKRNHFNSSSSSAAIEEFRNESISAAPFSGSNPFSLSNEPSPAISPPIEHGYQKQLQSINFRSAGRPKTSHKSAKTHLFTRKRKSKDELESIRALSKYMDRQQLDEQRNNELRLFDGRYDSYSHGDHLNLAVTASRNTRKADSASSLGSELSWQSEEEERLFHSRRPGTSAALKGHVRSQSDTNMNEGGHKPISTGTAMEEKKSKTIKGKSRHRSRREPPVQPEMAAFASYKYKGSRKSVDRILDVELPPVGVGNVPHPFKQDLPIGGMDDAEERKEYRGFRNTFFRNRTTKNKEKSEWGVREQTAGGREVSNTRAAERRRKHKDSIKG